MSVLSDRDIRRSRVFLGPDEEPWRLQPASIEVTLNPSAGSLLAYPAQMPIDGYVIDPESPPEMQVVPWSTLPRQGERSWRLYYDLPPFGFVLGSTAEVLTLDSGLCAAIEGKSSLGRLGLMVHATARFVDPGFQGRPTLELFNVAPRPIRLWAGMRIGQVRFERLSSPSERPYGYEGLGSHYQGSLTTVQARSVMQEVFDREFHGNWATPDHPV
jgi:dCTP deaminase